MRGEIVVFDPSIGEGEIAGDDFARYRFSASETHVPASLRVGARIEFLVGADKQVREIVLLTSATPRSGDRGAFDLGRVIQRTFTSIRQNWAIFFGAAVVLIGIPSLVMNWGQAHMTSQLGLSAVGTFGVGLLLYLAGFYLMQGVLLKTAINGFNSKSTTFDSVFGAATRVTLPLLGLSILVGLGIGAGFVLLIVPGVFLCILWVVAAPVLVAERRGIFDSLKRSSELTEGHRWSVLGLLIIYMLLSWIISLPVAALAFAIGGAQGLPMMIGNTVVNILSGVGASAGAASLYYELRTAKEGVGADELAAVFD